MCLQHCDRTTLPSAVRVQSSSGRPVPCEHDVLTVIGVCLQHCDRTTLPSAVRVQSGSGRPVERPESVTHRAGLQAPGCALFAGLPAGG